ncbi:uncharacterized protein LOC100183534 isoform X2 [Ciona intestinalis]
MEAFEWNPEFQEALSNFQWDSDLAPEEKENVNFGNCGILSQIGCDYASIIMEVMTVEDQVEKKAPPRNNSILPQPRSSSLTVAQHAHCIRNMEMFLSKVLPPNPTRKQRIIHKDLNALHKKYMEEKVEFSEYAMQNAIHQIAFYNFVNMHVNNFIQHRIAFSLLSLKTYLQHYVHNSSFIISVIPFVNDPQPKFEQLAVSTGSTAPIIKFPKCPMNIPHMNHDEKDHQVWKISEDPNAQKLAVKWQANIVLSLSSLRVLTNNFSPYNEEWEMPMVVKMIQGRKVVFIDKAFISKSLTARERNHIYYKHNIKNYLKSKGEINPQTRTAKEVVVNTKPFVSGEVPDDGEIPVRREKPVLGEASDFGEAPLIGKAPDLGETPEEINKIQLEIASPIKSQPETDDEDEEKNQNFNNSIKPLESIKLGNLSGSDTTEDLTDSIALEDETEAIKAPATHASIVKIEYVDPEAESIKNDRSSPPEFSDVDSDGCGLTIDDEDYFDLPIPQLDGANDKKKKNPTRISRRNRKQAVETEEKPKVEKSEPTSKPSFLSATVNSDVWQHTFSQFQPSSSQKSVVTSNQPTRTSWVQQHSTNTDSEEAMVTESSQIKDGDSDDCLVMDTDDEDNSPLSSTTHTGSGLGLTYGMSESPIFGSGIQKVIKESPAASTILGTYVDTRESSSKLKTRKSKSFPKQKQSKTTIARSGRKSMSQSALETSSSDSENLEASNDSGDNELFTKPSASKTKKKQSEVTKYPLKSESLISSTPKTPSTKTGPASKILKAKPPVKKKTPEKESSVDLLGQILGMQKERRESIDDKYVHDVPTSAHSQEQRLPPVQFLDKEELQTRSDGQVCFYSLWLFGEIRVLIRGTIHGKMTVGQNKSSYESNVVIRSKLEYQPELGYEQLTLSEVSTEWIHLMFRPKPSSILRCRIAPSTDKIMCCDVLNDLNDLTPAYNITGFNEKLAVKLLNVLFQKLSSTSFNPGTFLICHKAGSREIITRTGMSNLNDRMVLYDLQKEYGNPGRFVACTANTMPYVSLDPMKQLPWQEKANHLPGTFDCVGRENAGEKVSPSTKKKKKKAKKAKKLHDMAVGRIDR